MRALRAAAMVIGGLVLATAGLVVGVWLGPTGGGQGIALLGVIGGLWVSERGMGMW